jgi:hypothetical protein
MYNKLVLLSELGISTLRQVLAAIARTLPIQIKARFGKLGPDTQTLE